MPTLKSNKLAVNKQIQNVFEDEELQENATISKMEIVDLEGNREVSRAVVHYNMMLAFLPRAKARGIPARVMLNY